MSINVSNSSKVVSVRIPNPMHIAILRNASKTYMNKSDYIFFILDNYLNDHLIELREGDVVYSKDRIEVLHDCMKLQNNEEERLKNENKMLAEKCELLEKDNRRLKELIRR